MKVLIVQGKVNCEDSRNLLYGSPDVFILFENNSTSTRMRHLILRLGSECESTTNYRLLYFVCVSERKNWTTSGEPTIYNFRSHALTDLAIVATSARAPKCQPTLSLRTQTKVCIYTYGIISLSRSCPML